MSRSAARALILTALLASCAGPAAAIAPTAASTKDAAQSRAATATPADPCARIQQATVPNGSSPAFPVRSAADVLRGVAADPLVAHTLEDLAGVRPGPLRDPRVPLCRVDLLSFAQPVFVRRYPSSAGEWLVPVEAQGDRILTLFVFVDANGDGRISGSRGGFPVLVTEADARAAGGTAGDPVVGAELVLAKPLGCAPRDTISWRLVRRSGTGMYLVPGYPGSPPPGALLPEDQMEFNASGVSGPRAAKLRAAC